MKLKCTVTLKTRKRGGDAIKWRKGTIFTDEEGSPASEIFPIPNVIKEEYEKGTGHVVDVTQSVISDPRVTVDITEPGLDLSDDRKNELVGKKSWSKSEIVQTKKDELMYVLWERFPDSRNIMHLLNKKQLDIMAAGYLGVQ